MNAVKKINIFLCFCLAFLFGFGWNLSAESKSIVLGGKTGWPELLSKDGVTFGRGRFGYESVELATNARAVTCDTDLLLDFENFDTVRETFGDQSGHYAVQSNSLLRSPKSVMGHHSALSRGNGTGLVLRGNPETFFGRSGGTGSWTIEFWLCPAIAENGERVFEWHSSRIVNNYVTFQRIEAAFFNNRIQWNFTNIFDGMTDNGGEVNLLSYSALIPNKWSHHEISYDEESGLLECKIDSRVEALKYITEGGREGKTIYQPVLGEVAPISIAPAYTGCVDDFRILSKVTDSSQPQNLNYDKYKIDGGRFESAPIMVNPGSVMNSLQIVENVPPQTEIRYYVRSGDNFYNWNDAKKAPKWIRVKNGQDIKGVKGRYFQIAADLFPDGAGRHTPSVTEIKINYTQVPPPIAPFKVKAVAGDGLVDLSWSYSVDENVGGYYIFYGNRPGEYLGTDANEGPSPIKVDNITSFRLTGLRNGAIYYFAVSTYAKDEAQISGNLSNEADARPGRR
ncbi:MAG: fibronectin type III domain-containing protein [Treponema sp.]|nr:fibronectin type III domain-containing protein [Treponema sp.]